MTKIFDVYDDTVTNSENLNMRFKHVQNFDKESAQILLIQSYDNYDDQIKTFFSNYHMLYDEAIKRITQYNAYERERNAINMADKRVIFGFLVTMKLVENKFLLK